jgi:hypothetical protein
MDANFELVSRCQQECTVNSLKTTNCHVFNDRFSVKLSRTAAHRPSTATVCRGLQMKQQAWQPAQRNAPSAQLQAETSQTFPLCMQPRRDAYYGCSACIHPELQPLLPVHGEAFHSMKTCQLVKGVILHKRNMKNLDDARRNLDRGWACPSQWKLILTVNTLCWSDQQLK